MIKFKRFYCSRPPCVYNYLLSERLKFLVYCDCFWHTVNGDDPQFTYLGPYGPRKWGSLSPTYSACSHGKFQSPVNIVKSKCVHGRHLKPLDVEYNAAVNATLVDNYFNVQVCILTYDFIISFDFKIYNFDHVLAQC